MAAAAGAASWTWAPSHSALSSQVLNLRPRPALLVAAIPRGGRWKSPKCRLLSVRNNATSQDKTVGTQSSKTPSDSVEEQEEEVSEAATATGGEDEVSIVQSKDTTGAQPQRQQKQEIGDALRELRKQDPSSKAENFWTGLAEEIGLIEWPSFSKVFGTTLVVLGIILGSSFVLLTVNFLLAELSDLVFKIQ